MTHCYFEPENPTKRHGNECKLQSTVDASSGWHCGLKQQSNQFQTALQPTRTELRIENHENTAQLHELFWVKVCSCYTFSLGSNVERQITNFPLAPSHFTCASSFKGDYVSTRLLLSHTALQCAYGESFGKELVRSHR